MRRLRDGEWIAGAGGVALLASLFLHWYGLEIGSGWTRFAPFPPYGTAWEAFAVLDVVLALLALVPLALVVTHATRASPSIPVAFSVFTTVAGPLAALLILYRIANQPGSNEEVTVEIGAWVGLLAALVTGFGGFRSLRVEPIPATPMPPIEDLPAPAP